MKRLINLYSIAVAKAFAFSYHKSNDSKVTLALLDHYRDVRRQLPIVVTKDNRWDSAGRHVAHWGNHIGSGHKPWLATQG